MFSGIMLFIWDPEKPAGFSGSLFHGKRCIGQLGSFRENVNPGRPQSARIRAKIKYIFRCFCPERSGGHFKSSGLRINLQFFRVFLAPRKIVLQNDRGADRVQDLLAAAAKGAALVQKVGGGAGGLPLVPHAHRQAAPQLHGLCQLAAFGGALALGAVHIQRQTDQDHLGADLFGDLAHPGRHLVAGFEGDLRGDGRGKEFGAVAGGKTGTAVTVVYG